MLIWMDRLRDGRMDTGMDESMSQFIPGQVTGVTVVEVNSTAVNVTWQPLLETKDVSYFRVYYNSSDGTGNFNIILNLNLSLSLSLSQKLVYRILLKQY